MSDSIKTVEIVERYEPGKKPKIVSLVAYDEAGEVVDTAFSIPRKDPRIVLLSTPKGKNPFYDSKHSSNEEGQGEPGREEGR